MFQSIAVIIILFIRCSEIPSLGNESFLIWYLCPFNMPLIVFVTVFFSVMARHTINALLQRWNQPFFPKD